MNLVKLIFISLFLFTTTLLKAQTFIYSYTDPCTGLIKSINVPSDGVTVTYFGQIQTFSNNDFQNGAFDTWAESIYNSFGNANPCGSVIGVSTAVDIAQGTALNFISVINSISALSDLQSAMGGGSLNTMSAIESAKSSSNKKDKKDKNKSTNGNVSDNNTQSNGQSNSTNQSTNQSNTQSGSTNQSTGQTDGQNTQSTSGQSSSSSQNNTNQTGSNSESNQTNSQNNSNSTNNSGENNTQNGQGNTTSSNESSTTNSNSQSPNSQNSESNTNGQNGIGNTESNNSQNQSNTTGEQSNVSGNQNSSNNSNNSETNNQNTNSGTEQSNSTNNTSQNNSTNSGNETSPQTGTNEQNGQSSTNGETSGQNTNNETAGQSTEGSQNAGQSNGNGGGSGESSSEVPGNENTTQNTEDKKTNFLGGTVNSTQRSTESNKPQIVLSSDFAGFNFKDNEVTFGGKGTAGYSAMSWDGRRSYGVLLDYTSVIRGPNITGFYANLAKKRIDLISLTATFSFYGRGSQYASLAVGQMWNLNKSKSLKALYMATASFGNVYGEKFLGTAFISGGMYDWKVSKRIDIKLMNLFIYAPYVSYYNDILLKSPYVIMPIVGTNIGITKKFKFNINFGGAYAINENIMNFTLMFGTRFAL
jgi:hypothetical protein